MLLHSPLGLRAVNVLDTQSVVDDDDSHDCGALDLDEDKLAVTKRELFGNLQLDRQDEKLIAAQEADEQRDAHSIIVREDDYVLHHMDHMLRARKRPHSFSLGPLLARFSCSF